MVEASKKVKEYLFELQRQTKRAHDFANKARSKKYDPEDRVEVVLTENMAERVVGLISTIAPQIKSSNLVKRIKELEKKYGVLDFRIAFVIAEEIATQKICKFDSKVEAMEVGVKTAFAYITLGTVSACLEGLTHIEIKKRRDGEEYLCMHYAGPIRNAGGTTASFSVLIGDYIRRKMGYGTYDPDEKEINRVYSELEHYHERVTPLQYFPSKPETDFFVKNIPVEIGGNASEKIEVPNYKNLPRVPTDCIRAGFCLTYAECLALKAPKLLSKISKWKDEERFSEWVKGWDFLEEFLRIQKIEKASSATEKREENGKTRDLKINPVYTYIVDLVGGRPVLAHPLVNGGFRLRYGRSRVSGYSSQCIHPATMLVLSDLIAVGTQLKQERPGKATTLGGSCNTIEGPIVKLRNGNVLQLNTVKEAKQYKNEIAEVLFLGDLLVAYGDFFDRAHILCPPGYCEEWWAQELEKSIVDTFGSFDLEKASELAKVDMEILCSLIKNPFAVKPLADLAVRLSVYLGVPLHPKYTFHWKDIDLEKFDILMSWLEKAQVHLYDKDQKIIIKNSAPEKRVLEELGIPHVVSVDYIVVEGDFAIALFHQMNEFEFDKIRAAEASNALEKINTANRIKIRDKSGVYIGARMGRPEKAKMRQLKGSPHGLFPVGDEGGRMRSFQAALEKGRVNSTFSIFKCKRCDRITIYPRCEDCGKETIRMKSCRRCGLVPAKKCKHKDESSLCKEFKLNIKHYFEKALKKLGTTLYPDLIKGVRGTVNKEHIPENLIKAILRAKHSLYVNKDGTIRYDAILVPVTYFKPREISVSAERLKGLGYEEDIYGNLLENEDQILELKCQDIILPCCSDIEYPADEVFFNTTKFVDELLVKLYGVGPFYNLKSKKDLVGHLLMGLAPHTSAGTTCRIIGFSKTQGFMCHPLMVAAQRRDCFAYDTLIPIKTNEGWSIEKIGRIANALNPSEVVDGFGTKEARVDAFETIGMKDKKLSKVKINNFTKHAPNNVLEIKTALGKTLQVTENHKFLIKSQNGLTKQRANRLNVGDKVPLPIKISIPIVDREELNLFEIFKNERNAMIRGLNRFLEQDKSAFFKIAKSLRISKSSFYNYLHRDSYPIHIVGEFVRKKLISKAVIRECKVATKCDHVELPTIIKLDRDLLQLFGLYIAEGYSRKVRGKKGLYQVYFSALDPEIRSFIESTMFRHFGLKNNENKLDREVFSSKLLYLLFTKFLKCGHNSYEKRIPSVFLDLPLMKLGALLSGYFEGDGSVNKTDLRVTCDSVSEKLLVDLEFCMARFGIFVKRHFYEKEPGEKIKEYYKRKNRRIPIFGITKLIIGSDFVSKFGIHIGFISKRKRKILSYILKNKKSKGMRIEKDRNFVYDPIISIEELGKRLSYCLNTEGSTVLANSVLTPQCDGDESGLLLLMDAFLNFSRRYLGHARGSTMDAPLVLTPYITPGEVDDMIFNMDTVWKYPLEFYNACLEWKMPWKCKIEQVADRLQKESQYENYGFTHDNGFFDEGVMISAYKTLPAMKDKLRAQMEVAEKVRAVDTADVASLVITKHFLKDIKGNLRKFSQQQFRCVKCNTKYRRPPLIGKCTNPKCKGGRIIFTISEGSVTKYLEPSIEIANKYNVSDYVKQTLELTKLRINSVFGKDKEKQEGLNKWFVA